ncbi:hypothetical protein [Parafilimonas terrae]|uniref:Uncharacterized protein n=1 Tax=Parafilimonas terrae TaxID=1465490 RepID=A0A1I5RS78_9BACT|nr:hypothetical protein [Parafilimonas terrae]SFP61375.1 hypothetical protein SAMN05444277_101393 [Parafilimonas terrae]
MEALRIRGVAKEGILTIPVPDKFEGKDLEVIVLTPDENDTAALQEDLQSKKVERLFKVIGTAKDTTTTFDKHDVYNQ